MADTDIFVDSLRNRIRAMNQLWNRALSDMSLEQFNHHEREGVLPIAFSFSHYIKAQDQSVSGVFLKEPPLWVTGGWAPKTGISIDKLGREETVEEMQHIPHRRSRRLAPVPGARHRPNQPGARDDHARAVRRRLHATAAAHAEHLLRHRHRPRQPPAQAGDPGVLRLPARPPPHGRGGMAARWWGWRG